jgi:NAD(P)-dependent dehydrogenase (short-subunit alcohol dehydrogenase family)
MSEPRGVAVITGGSGGVGVACARRFAPGHRLVLADVNPAALARAVATLDDEGIADVTTVVCDVRDPAAVAALVDAARAAGPLQTLAHTAGLSPSMADAWEILDVNLLGTMNVLDALLPLAGPGTVAVCVASIAGYKRGVWRHDALLGEPAHPDFRARLREETGIDGHPGLGYALSKRGVHLLVERRAHAWGRRGARLVSVSPGLIIDTPMGALEAPKGAKDLEAISALGRAATADDIAAACALLASSDAAYLTGCDLRVDGGSIPGFVHHATPEATLAWDEPAY